MVSSVAMAQALMGPKRDLIGEMGVAARKHAWKSAVGNHSIVHYDLITDHVRVPPAALAEDSASAIPTSPAQHTISIPIGSSSDPTSPAPVQVTSVPITLISQRVTKREIE